MLYCFFFGPVVKFVRFVIFVRIGLFIYIIYGLKSGLQDMAVFLYLVWIVVSFGLYVCVIVEKVSRVVVVVVFVIEKRNLGIGDGFLCVG